MAAGGGGGLAVGGVEAIGLAGALPAGAAEELRVAGFVVIPGPVAPEGMGRLVAAYDAAMASGDVGDLRIGSTTTRLSDLVNHGVEFDEVYVYAPLLEACAGVIGGPFRLSSMLGRTVRPQAGAQELHVDLGREPGDGPMVGFILMIDAFREENGATRFVPGSHGWAETPEQRMDDRRGSYAGEVLAVGVRGSLIVFNGAVWHGHTANRTGEPRRSIQGYFVRREVRPGMNLAARMLPETLGRIGPEARYVLALPEASE